jgi:uncharacterized repeat protein (TIGR03803 family)
MNIATRKFSMMPFVATLLLSLAFVFARPAQAAAFTEVMLPGSTVDGVIQGLDGRLYGTTYDGGTNSKGTLFAYDPSSSSLTVLYNFTGGGDGWGPGALMLDPNSGKIYGTTLQGLGTLFVFDPATGSLATLYSFGFYGQPKVSVESHGYIYGAFTNGSTGLFRAAMDGSGYTIIHSFTSYSARPGSLVLGPDGLLYGETLYDGVACNPALYYLGCGTLFRLKPVLPGDLIEQFELLYSFNFAANVNHLNYPMSLIYGSDGLLYGTNSYNLFKLDPNNAATFQFVFTDGGGISLWATEGSDSLLYMSEYSRGSEGAGWVYSIAKDGSGLSVLHNFSFVSGLGAYGPVGPLYRDAAGTIYGTTEYTTTDPSFRGTLFAIGGAPTPDQAPTNIFLSNAAIAENSPIATVIGTFTSSDPDVGDSFTYSLVGGVGATDNAAFSLVAGVLSANALFDFETKSSYSIRISSTDAGGLSFDKVFTIVVTDVNEAPTDIALSNASVAEDSPAGTVIGNLSTVDPDAGDTFTYTFVGGAGSADNASFNFSAVGDVLRTSAAFNFEAKSAYSIRVRSTDANGLSVDKVFAISVTDVNEAPINLALSNSTIGEGLPVATLIGTLSNADPDAGDTIVYSLVFGAGGDDNGAFTISASALQSNAVFDAATKSAYTIRVRATDAAGLFVDKVFAISVIAVNKAPTDLTLSNNTIADGLPIATTIGTFSSIDPNAGDTFVYTLVAGVGSTDNSAFTIAAGMLKSNAVFDFATKSAYSIRVRTTDSGGLLFEKAFAIGVTHNDRAPTDLALSNTTIAENTASGTSIGTLSSTDADAGDTFTYTLVGRVGATDNASFAIVSGVLRSGAVFDFETKSSYSIRVRSTDASGLFVEKVLAIGVTNVNEPPTNIALSNASVAENLAVGATVGSASTSDPDAGDTFTYSLVAGAGSTDNASFTFTGNTLKTSAVFDFETKVVYSIRVRSIDAGGLFVEKTFTISVTNINEAPAAVADSAVTSKGNSVIIDVLGNDSDPDGDALIISAVTQPANGSATINGGMVTYKPRKNFTGADSFSYTISDGKGLTATATVSISVITGNAPPRAVTDRVVTPIGTPLVIAVLANDTDPEGDPLTLVSVTQGANGTVTAHADGTLTYTPAGGFTGHDSFTYTISDGHGGTAIGTVSVRVSKQ